MADSDSLGIAEMVKRVSEQQNTQACEIQKSKEVLTQLQAQLQDLEMQRKSVVAERKAVERQTYFSEEAIATAQRHCEDLESQISNLYAEDVKLTRDANALQEEFETTLLGNRAYYEKVAAHRKRFEEAESKLPFVVALKAKRDTLQQLMGQKKELTASLREAEGQDTAGQVQEEILGLQSEIKALKEAAGEMEKAVRDERSRQANLQKEIELQNKRGEAVFRRLRCQINNLELERSQGRWKVQQLEEKAEELRKLWQATEE